MHLRNALSAIWTHALKTGCYRGTPPTAYLSTPTVPSVQAKTALTAIQARALLAQMREPYRTLALVVMSCGLRIGEALALDWEHVDLERRVVRIRRNFTHGEFGTLKTLRSVRDLPLSEEAALALETMESRHVQYPGAWLVFRNRYGQPLDAHNIAARELKPACRLAGVPVIGWHVLRHTAITLIQQAGATGIEAQRFAGHASEAMRERYTHAEVDRLRESVDAVRLVEETKERLM